MNKFYIFSISCLAILLASCSNKYKVEGVATLGSLGGNLMYLKSFDKNKWCTVDSAQIIHGAFMMCGNITNASPKLVTLFVDNTPLTPIVLERGHIQVDLNSSTVMIHGTPLNNKLYAFYAQNQSLEQKSRSALAMLPSDKLNQEVLIKHQQLIKDFIINNKANVLSPAIYTIYKKHYPQLVNCEEIMCLFNHTEEEDNTLQTDHYDIEIMQDLMTSYPTDFFLW